MLTKVFLLPLIWLVIGWVLIQGSIVLGLIKTEKTKFSRPIHLAMLGNVLLYTAIMLPYGIETVRVMILQLQYQQNPSLYPNGFQFSPHIPAALNSLELAVMRVTLVQPALFYDTKYPISVCSKRNVRTYIYEQSIDEGRLYNCSHFLYC